MKQIRKKMKVEAKVKLWASVFLLLFAGFANAQQRYELTIKEAVDLAYKNVVEIQNAQIDYKLQEAKNREILGSAYPQLSGSVSANRYLKLPAILFPDATSSAVYQILKNEGVSGAAGPITKVPEPTFRQVSFQQPWNLTAGATVSQLLFQPDVFVGLQARETALDFSREAIEVAKEKIKDSAYKRYYAILVVEKQLWFANQNIERLQKLYHDDSLMYKNGFAERLDLDKVQVQLNNLYVFRSTLEGAVNISYAALKLSLGIPQTDTVVLKEELNSTLIKNDLLDESFTYENRAVVRSLDYAKRLQELDLKRNKMSAYPTISAVGNYSVNGMGQKFFTSSQTLWLNSSFIGLNMNIPIFDGSQRKSKIQQSQLNVQKVANTITNIKQVIDFEQTVAKQSLRTALTTLDAQERNMQLTEKVYNATKLKFQQGMGSSFEVLQADTDYQTAQLNYFNSLYNAVVAKISYQSSLGKLQ